MNDGAGVATASYPRPIAHWPIGLASAARTLRGSARRVGPPPPAQLGRVFRQWLPRAGVPAAALVAYVALERAFIGIGAVQEYGTALLLALLASGAQVLLDRRAAGRLPIVASTKAVQPPCGCATRPGAADQIGDVCPEPATPKAFNDAVRRALTHLCDPTRLAVSPLLQLPVISDGLHDQGWEDTRLNRAAVLKVVLVSLLEELRPRHHAGDHTGEAWRFYNCLYYPYVVGATRRRAPTVLRSLREHRLRMGGPRSEMETALDWLLQVDEDTYYKWQRRGSDTIALALRERVAGGDGDGQTTRAPRAGRAHTGARSA